MSDANAAGNLWINRLKKDFRASRRSCCYSPVRPWS